jgi:hypothetical protein
MSVDNPTMSAIFGNGALGLTLKNRATTSFAPQLIIQPGSFGSNPIQEEVDGGLSMPFLGFWIRCDAVECEALSMPKHKIEEHVSRKLRVIHLDLTVGRRLTQYT